MLEGYMNQYERCRKQIKEKGFAVCRGCIMYRDGECDLFPNITAIIPTSIPDVSNEIQTNIPNIEEEEDGESR